VTEPARPPGRRTQIARLRATRVKVVLAAGAAVAFGASMLFARLSYAGHAKHTAKTLNPPPRFLDIVRSSRLQSGFVAAPQAPPAVSTSTS